MLGVEKPIFNTAAVHEFGGMFPGGLGRQEIRWVEVYLDDIVVKVHQKLGKFGDIYDQGRIKLSAEVNRMEQCLSPNGGVPKNMKQLCRHMKFPFPSDTGISGGIRGGA